MWPWEHLAFGYLWYSLYSRAVRGERPGDTDVLVLVFATQVPDLVDKPLAWGLGVLPNALTLAHSLIFGLPVCVFVLGLSEFLGYRQHGVAYCLGYLSHLAGDVIYPFVVDGTVRVGFLLWPVTESAGSPTAGFLSQVALFLQRFRVFLGSPRGQTYLLFEAGLLLTCLVLWLADGWPGIPVGRERRCAGRAPDSQCESRQ